MQVIAFLHFVYAFLAVVVGEPEPGKITKVSITAGGQERNCYVFLPKNETKSGRLPLLVTLHGSGRRGDSLVQMWKKLADKEGFVVAGPDALNPQVWSVPDDGPQPLYEMVEVLKQKLPIDARRVYLFGHSAGGVFTLLMGLMESNYFAAGALSAGALTPENYERIDPADRKIPFTIFVGARDPFFPLDLVRGTRDALQARGVSANLIEIPNHNHNYYALADRINEEAWEFLKQHALKQEPTYKPYRFY